MDVESVAISITVSGMSDDMADSTPCISLVGGCLTPPDNGDAMPVDVDSNIMPTTQNPIVGSSTLASQAPPPSAPIAAAPSIVKIVRMDRPEN